MKSRWLPGRRLFLSVIITGLALIAPRTARDRGGGTDPDQSLTPPTRELLFLLSGLRRWPRCTGRDLIFIAFGSRVLWQIVTQTTLTSARGCRR
jgi:hypothetical protein